MRPELYYSTSLSSSLVPLLTSLLALPLLCASTQVKVAGRSLPELTIYSNYFDPTPSPEDGPPLSAGALRNPAYLPAQIGGIVGAYALSLVITASILLLLAKKRRAHITAGEEDLAVAFRYDFEFTQEIDRGDQVYSYPDKFQTPTSPITNFSYPLPPTPSVERGQSPYPSHDQDPHPYPFSGPYSTYSTSTLGASTLGVNHLVDQRVVAADREMAQHQLEEMYKYVMEHEAAKEAGTPIEGPPTPLAKMLPPSTAPAKQGILKRGKGKPANLDLYSGEPEKQSRASSILSALKSPRKKNTKGIKISSPIMTPMSGTFPRDNEQEMHIIPPRHYAPASPPPVPVDQHPYAHPSRHQGPMASNPTPDMSPESTQSIDERIGAQFGRLRMGYNGPPDHDPVSATSERSTTPLIGLPSSPKPTATKFPTLPASPKPGATFPTSPRPGASFSRPNAPSAVRTGGTLPLRAYEPSLSSPSLQTTKQTTFERAPLSPGMRTPWTGAPVPYSPYQPFSPVVPVTPSLVTKADRKRMKQLQPKTPTTQMVQSTDDLW